MGACCRGALDSRGGGRAGMVGTGAAGAQQAGLACLSACLPASLPSPRTCPPCRCFIQCFALPHITYMYSQVVVGTLMNICDNPNRVSVGQDWIEGERLRRIPIIVTGAPPLLLAAGCAGRGCALLAGTGLRWLWVRCPCWRWVGRGLGAVKAEPVCLPCLPAMVRCVAPANTRTHMPASRTMPPLLRPPRQRPEHGVCSSGARRAHGQVLLAAHARGLGGHSVPGGWLLCLLWWVAACCGGYSAPGGWLAHGAGSG